MASRFCPRSIAQTKNKCGVRYESFWITGLSECFLPTARQFYPTRVNGCAVCSRAETVNHEWTRIDTKRVPDWKDREPKESDWAGQCRGFCSWFVFRTRSSRCRLLLARWLSQRMAAHH